MCVRERKCVCADVIAAARSSPVADFPYSNPFMYNVCVCVGGAIFLYAECCNCGVRCFQPIRKRREWGSGKGGRSLRRERAGRRGRLKRMMCWGDFVRQAEEKIPAFC